MDTRDVGDKFSIKPLPMKSAPPPSRQKLVRVVSVALVGKVGLSEPFTRIERERVKKIFYEIERKNLPEMSKASQWKSRERDATSGFEQ